MFGVLFAALAGGIWIGLTLAITGTLMLGLFRNIPLDKLLPQYAWNILTTQELLALPLFIVMGEILFRTKLSRSLFQGLAPWTGLLPGRLLHVNVVGCSIFAAISGSSAATTQVVGRIALAELLKRGYGKDIAIGSLAGAGTLGFLIPPSNIMIIYGVLGDVSILKLFTAGFIPGALLAAAFMAWIMIHTALRPAARARRRGGAARRALVRALPGAERPRAGDLPHLRRARLDVWRHRDAVRGRRRRRARRADRRLAARRADAAGAARGGDRVGADLLDDRADRARRLDPRQRRGVSRHPGRCRRLRRRASACRRFLLILALIVFYLILGCFLDGFSMIVMTLPIVLPIVKAAGFDPVWFGVFLVLVVEMAQITPPVGFNLFVIQGLTDDGLGYIAKVTLPYLIIMVAFTMLVTLFPQIVLWLPAALAR